MLYSLNFVGASFLGLALFTLVRGQTLGINVTDTLPWGSSRMVDHSFPSFAIQMSSFPAYTGNHTNPNEFSRNLIETISNRTGTPIEIRVGGTNGDRSSFDPNQTHAIDVPKSEEGSAIPQNITIGPSFFEGFSSFPGTKWVFSAPVANRSFSDCIRQSKLAVRNIGVNNLNALELGNEPDLYVAQGYRDQGWGPANWTSQWKNFAKAVSQNVSLPTGPIFQGLTLFNRGVTPWTVENLMQQGINSGNNMKSVSQHHYETTIPSGAGLQKTMMNHTYISKGLNGFLPSLDYLLQPDRNISLVLGEVGRYTPGTVSSDGLQGVFGSALYTADYLLYAMSLNITRVNMQQGVGFGYNAWHPIKYGSNVPDVRAPYYGQVFVADFIGTNSKLQIKHLDLKQGRDDFAAYAGYVSGKLRKVALINFHAWNQTDGKRPERSIKLKVPGDVTSVKVEQLTAPGGATAMQAFTWAGYSWTYKNKGVGAKIVNDTAMVKVSDDNIAMLNVTASSAVLVDMIR